MDRIAGQRQVLAHAVELDAVDEHLARVAIAMMWPPKKVCSASSDAWTLMLRVSRPTSPRSSTSKVILPKCM